MWGSDEARECAEPRLCHPAEERDFLSLFLLKARDHM